MRLTSPCNSQDFQATDIYGQTIRLNDFQGRHVMLCFFRDAACPFCNLRVYELSHQYKTWQESGLEVIAVFSSTAQEVRQFVAQHPRPFRLIADPDLLLYQKYGVEHSSSAIFKALIFKLPRIFAGILKGGRPRKNPHLKLVPADFLIDCNGEVKEAWYGRDTADHIPLKKVEQFIAQMRTQLNLSEKVELYKLRAENQKLKAFILSRKKRPSPTKA